MAVHEHPRRSSGVHLPSFRRPRTTSTSESAESARTGTYPARAYAFASLRLLTGFVFLWAFLDKTFGFGYATPSGKGWIDGGSPTKGFLGSVAVGPMESTFHSWAGDPWANWLFMLGLLGIGLALVARGRAAARGRRGDRDDGADVDRRVAAGQAPLGRHVSMSTNPIVDYHLIYVVALIVLAAAAAGDTLGLGRLWAKLPLVRRNRWLR